MQTIKGETNDIIIIYNECYINIFKEELDFYENMYFL